MTVRKKSSLIWILLLVESYRNDLRLRGRFKFADQIKQRLESLGIKIRDIKLEKMKEFLEDYRQHRNLPDADLCELEMMK